VAPLRSLSVREQLRFKVSSRISGVTWSRFRAFLAPAVSGMATVQTLRAASAVASAEPANAVSTTGDGTFLLSPRAAVQAMVDNLVANEEFLERPSRDPAGPSVGDGADPGTGSDSTGSTCEDGPADSDVREEGPAQDPPPAGDRASENWSGLDALVTAAAL